MLSDIDGNNWSKMHFGTLTKEQIMDSIGDPTWQYTRRAMKGVSMTQKYRLCGDYLKVAQYSTISQIVVTNYVNALKRAGLVFERVNS